MTQMDLLSAAQDAHRKPHKRVRTPHFDGPDYVPKLDRARLTGQLERIYGVMQDGQWRTLRELAVAARAPESSVSAQLRHLRKERFGSYVVEKRRREPLDAGIFEYRVLSPEPR